jgi:hypothetical protein
MKFSIRYIGRRSLPFAVLAMSLVAFLAFVCLAAYGSSSFGSLSASGASSVACSSLPVKTLVSAPPQGAKGPDDLTVLSTPGLDYGRTMLWTAYQNGIDANGTPGMPGGPTQSVIAGYDAQTGALERYILVTGKVDGLTADPELGRLIATVNEDNNSAINLVNPSIGNFTTFQYVPNPAYDSTGGSDSIAVVNDRVYIAHSNPFNDTVPAVFEVTFDLSTFKAYLSALFFNNATATSATNGTTVQLGLTDPDTNYVMPQAGERFAGQLAQISQGDGQIVFAALQPPFVPSLTVMNLTDNKPGNVPPIDGLVVATTSSGTLYVVDAGANKILALDTTGCKAGTTFVGEPSDNSNPLVGTLNLSTGKITPLSGSYTYVSPKGMAYIPNLT